MDASLQNNPPEESQSPGKLHLLRHGSYPGRSAHVILFLSIAPWPRLGRRPATATVVGITRSPYSIAPAAAELASSQPQRHASSASRRKPIKCRFFASKRGKYFCVYCYSCTLWSRIWLSIQVMMRWYFTYAVCQLRSAMLHLLLVDFSTLHFERPAWLICSVSFVGGADFFEDAEPVIPVRSCTTRLRRHRQMANWPIPRARQPTTPQVQILLTV